MTDWEQLRLDGQPEPLTRWEIVIVGGPSSGRYRWEARRGGRIRRGRWWPTPSDAALAAMKLGATRVELPNQETELC